MAELWASSYMIGVFIRSLSLNLCIYVDKFMQKGWHGAIKHLS